MAATAEAITEMMTPTWTLGDRIAKARRHAGLEQIEMAEACGVSRALVSRWERDQSDPGVGKLQAVADLTGVDIAWLVDAGIRIGSLSPLVGLPASLTPELPFPAADRQLVAVGSW